jgi:hypothetical protein
MKLTKEVKKLIRESADYKATYPEIFGEMDKSKFSKIDKAEKAFSKAMDVSYDNEDIEDIIVNIGVNMQDFEDEQEMVGFFANDFSEQIWDSDIEVESKDQKKIDKVEKTAKELWKLIKGL